MAKRRDSAQTDFKHALRRARELRRNSTDAERLLWRHLRDRRLAGLKFRRQQPLGPFFADFVCLEAHLIVEVDGGQHAHRTRQDDSRTQYLCKLGFRVLRYWNNDVLRDVRAVLEEIWRVGVGNPHPSPLPQAGEGGRGPHPNPLPPGGRGGGRG